MSTDRNHLTDAARVIAHAISTLEDAMMTNYDLSPAEDDIYNILIDQHKTLSEYLKPEEDPEDYMIECSECGNHTSSEDGIYCCECLREITDALGI